MRPRVTEEELRQRLADAKAIEDAPTRRLAVVRARRGLAMLQYRSTLGSGERIRVQGR